MKYPLFFVLTTALSVSGCGNGEKLRKLETTVANQSLELAKIRERLIEREAYSSARLSPASGTYAVVETDVGVLTLAIVNVEPFANGSRVRIAVGNPQYADIFDIKAEARWGARSFDSEDSKYRDHTGQLSLGTVLGGDAVISEVLLEGVPPEKLDEIWVRNVTHGRVAYPRVR